MVFVCRDIIESGTSFFFQDGISDVLKEIHDYRR